MFLSKPIRNAMASVVLALLGIPAIAQPLNGTYTVGGTTPNYATLSDAVNDLNTKGVSGPVTLNIRNGNYTAAAWRSTIKSITGASATNRITIKSETNNAANVTISIPASTTATNFIIRLDKASFVTIKDLTLINDGASRGKVIELLTSAGNDSIVNCKLSTLARTTTDELTAVVFGTDLTGTNNVFMGNTISNGSYGIMYEGTGTTNLVNNATFINNTIQNAYEFGAYFYYTNNLKFINNTITSNSALAETYGLRSYYGDGTIEIRGNKISGFNGYGMYIYYSDATPTARGLIANNVIIMKNGTGINRGLQHYYSSYQTICNNTINVTGTSTADAFAGYFYYSATAYTGNEIYNNVFSNTGNGYAMFVRDPVSYNNKWDYNNLYSSSAGTRLIRRGTPATDYNDLNSWRVATNQDMNSIVFAPAFTNPASNLAPVAGNPSSWALNGRGVHIANLNTDINGNARVTTPAAGVPDIGAYEFVPSVLPPDITPVPATPAPGSTQVFLFGQDTVATITWDVASPVPASVFLKQHTNSVPPAINTISTTNMYFYTDIITTPGAYNFTANIYYKDPWIGTTISENVLRLAHKDAANPWVAYLPAVSKTDINRNIISTPGLSAFGLFTGVDVSNNAGVVEITEPTNYFCSGTFPVKVKVANTGNNVVNNVLVDWEIDGVAQPQVTYSTAIPVDGDAIVTLGNITLSNIPKNIKVWTSLPNGIADIFNGDDTLKRKLSGGLSGTYTVGGTTPDFASFVDAVTYLKDFGVCGPVTFNVRDGVYTGQALLDGPVDGMSAVNRVTFQSENHIAGNVVIGYDLAFDVTNNYILRMNNVSYLTLKDLTFRANNANYCHAVEIAGNSSFDSMINCTLIGGITATASVNTAVLFALDITGGNNTFIGNTVQNGSYGIYYTGVGTSSLTDGGVFYNNTLLNQFTYATYFYYTKDLKFNKNTITTNSTDNAFYGIHSYYGDEAIEIIGNKVTGALGGYGINVYYSDGTAAKRGRIANNVVAIGSGTNTTNALRNYYSSYMSVYNNSLNVLSTSATAGFAGYFYYSTTSYVNNEVYNNSFANSGGGFALYVYNTTFNNKFDYNNLYTTGPQLVRRGTPATDYATLAAWRTDIGLEMNSLSYNPGYISTTDLRPDVSNPAAWSLNGRGIHIAGNDKDYFGSPRVTAMADGVPDIGAYEFVPTTIPPVATATPANPAAGTTQVFTFGEDTVAVIAWKPNSIVPNTINVRQYTGTKPPQFSSPGFMYFYTDVDVLNVTHQFDAKFYYKDPWRGTTGAEAQLKLAQKLNNHPWNAYNDAASTADVNKNVITANNTMTSLGWFTGIDNGTIFSAQIIPLSSTVFCPGGSVTLQATTGASYTYQWQLNGVDIPNATNATHTATAAGDYTVKVTNTNNVTAVSLPVAVTIVATPAAIITATGPFNYCPGGNLTLNANTGIGLTYQWQFNGNDIPGATNTTLPVTSAGMYTVTVRNIGCATTSQVATVHPGPLDVKLGTDTSYCESGTPLVLDAGYPGASYTWSTGATTQQISLANQSGKFWVYVDAGPNCQASDTIVVDVDPLPSITGISYQFQGNNSFFFSPSGAKDVQNYLWIFDDGQLVTTKDVNYFNSDGKSFKVKLVVYNACGTDTSELFLPLNVTDAAKGEIAFKLYPNPAQSEITLSMEGGATFSDAAIINSIGQVVYRSKATGKSETINVSNLPAGHYIIRANTSDGNVISKPFEVRK